jgi:hypothetical protein
MAGVGEIISAVDYNTIQNKISRIMGTGVSTEGYGQTVASSQIVPDGITGILPNVLKTQWDALRFDIVNAVVHQTGSTPSITVIQTTDPIRYGPSHPNYQYNTLADQAVSQRFSLGTGQFVVEQPVAQAANMSVQRTTAWSSSLTTDLTITFSTVDRARFFFNSGSKIRFNSNRTGGSSNAQNTAWTNLLDSVGSVDFGGSSPTINYYALTSSFQTFYQSSASSPYAGNQITLQARCNVSDNSAGTANIVYFRVTYTDTYVDPGSPPPGDSVDGTLTLTVNEVRAAGSLLPSGSFSITGPSYSITAFSGS